MANDGATAAMLTAASSDAKLVALQHVVRALARLELEAAAVAPVDR